MELKDNIAADAAAGGVEGGWRREGKEGREGDI